MTNIIDIINAEHVAANREGKAELPKFRVGDTIRLQYRIKEGERERLQPFEGAVIKDVATDLGRNFTVRKIVAGIGVERTFCTGSPLLEKLEIVRHGKVRRAKLYYLRDLAGRAARIKHKVIKKTDAAKGKKATKVKSKPAEKSESAAETKSEDKS